MNIEKGMVLVNGVNLSVNYHKLKKPKATIILVHGYAEYIDRYDHVIDYLVSQDFEVLAYDQRSHGRSEGKQAYIEKQDLLADDLHAIYQMYAQGKTTFLLSHSMGGLVVSDYLIRYPEDAIRGAIFTAPAIQVPADLSPLLQKMSGIIASILPRLKTVKLDISRLTRDNEVLEKYLNDPYVYTDGTYAKTGSEILAKQKGIKSFFPKVKIPIVIYQGTADNLADPEGTKGFFEALGSEDKELRMLEGWYHEILNEPDHHQIFDSINSWISERI